MGGRKKKKKILSDKKRHKSLILLLSELCRRAREGYEVYDLNGTESDVLLTLVIKQYQK